MRANPGFSNKEMLTFTGAAHFRQRLVLSLLSKRTVRITEIRPREENVGMRDFEIRLLRLMEQVTNGTVVEINYTGTEVVFRPGTIYGGEVDFDCGVERSTVYFLEALLVLAPFSKLAFRITLQGITSDGLDQTIDAIKNAGLKILGRFGVEEGAEVRIERRGASPLGGGRIFFTCPVVSGVKAVQMVETGRIRKIRGVAATTRVSPQMANRMVEGARSQLNEFIPDIYIYTDVFRGEEAGRSSGYSLFLQAESTTGALLMADGIGVSGEAPEEMAMKVAHALLRQIKRGGMFGQTHQWIVLLLMALGPEDVSKVVLGPLARSVPVLLEDIRLFLGVVFKIREDQPRKGLTTVSCVGAGYGNFNRRTQ